MGLMQDSTYWNRFWRRRTSRRRLMAGTALAGSGLAAAAVFGCGGETPGERDNGNGNGNGGGTLRPLDPLSQFREYPSDGRREFVPASEGSRGGSLRYVGYDPVVLDRYDPHQTQFGPMYSNLSAVFSKLYVYASHEEPTWENIWPDLAESAPEMIGDPPDTYVIKLRRGVKFHDTDKIRKNFPSLAGRELTADDVVFSFDRQKNENSPQRPYYYRSSQYKTIEQIEKVDDYTIRITTKGPVAPFYHFMADTNAMIIPREIVDEGNDTVDVTTGPKPEDRMVGTGPFIWDTLQWGIQFKAVRNPEWFGWGEPELGRPYLDGYVGTGQGLNDATVEALFREKKIDTAGFIDNPGWMIAMKNQFPDLKFQKQQTSGWVNTRFKLYCQPFDDWRVRRALHLAVDRQEILDVMGGGEWYVSGPVNGAISYWAIPQEELESMPGYRRTRAEREADIQEARQLYEAAGSPPLPQAWFADIPNYITRYAPTYVETIRRNIGAEVKWVTQNYARIAEGLVKEDCDLTVYPFGYDNGWIDLDDWVFPYFHSTGSKNSFKLSDPELDAMLDAQRAEFDGEARRELGYRIQKYLLGELKQDAPGANARLDYASPGGGSLAWPYVRNRTSWPWFGNNYWSAQTWLDRSDPSFQGRAA